MANKNKILVDGIMTQRRSVSSSISPYVAESHCLAVLHTQSFVSLSAHVTRPEQMATLMKWLRSE